MKKPEHYDMKHLRKEIKKVQDGKRYEHTLGVEYTAAALAMRFGADLEKAQIAGLLHDCAKCISDQEKLSICKKHKITITGSEQKAPFLLHAKVGAYLAQNKYGVEDKDILNAITYHTTGRENMSLLEKIVFVADYIEPGRKHAPNLAEIRFLAFQNLDHALIRILEDTLNYLGTSGEEVDPSTEITYKYYSNSTIPSTRPSQNDNSVTE